MATLTHPEKIARPLPDDPADLTVVDIADRFGPIRIDRIRWSNPAPGRATEDDVVAIHDREKLLYELVDGVLVRKIMGWDESVVACTIIRHLGNHVAENRLGTVAGEAGMYRLNPDLIRIPDVSFISAGRLPQSRSRRPVCPIVPDLAVEVLSEGNTRKEMEEKLVDYFAAGVRLVWYVDPEKKTVHVYHSESESRLLQETDTLDGGDVLPGFTLPLKELFRDPAVEDHMA